MGVSAVLRRRLGPNPQSLRARSVTGQENLTAVVKDLADGKSVLDLPVGPPRHRRRPYKRKA